MPKYIEGVELTQEGMHAIFARMGQPNIISGCIYNANPTIDNAALDRQGYMPVLAGVSPTQTSGHWIMLIKGSGNDYYLYDPLGQASGTHYQNILARKIAPGTLTVIPNEPGLNMGLCGYWVASAGLRARAALNQAAPPNLDTLGQTITQEMRDELANAGYQQITGWLRAVGDEFPTGGVQADASALRKATEKALGTDRTEPTTVKPSPVIPTVATQPTAQKPTVSLWNGFSLYTDDNVKHAIQHSFTHFLGKPYTGPMEREPARIGGSLIYRQHHGLSHTLRTMAYAEIIVEEARKAKQRGERLVKAENGQTLADVTPEELKKIMIAQAFFVAGRDDEDSTPKKYYLYHKQSSDAFLNYVKNNQATLIPDVFKDNEDVQFYADIIEDKKKEWGKTPAHVLINQGHMVDLMRVKQPAESFLYSFYTSMQPWLGAQGTEAVFAKQRQFFHATHEAVSEINPNNTDLHLAFGPKGGSGFYLIGPDGKPVREEGNLKFISSMADVPKDHRYMRVNEFLALEETRNNFPLDKLIEGGFPGMDYVEYDNHLNHINRARCENEVDFCLGRLQAASQQTRIDPLKQTFQAAASQARRAANADEIAAASIIQQIMANPDCIQDNHVFLNGERLEEAFFRELLAKCEMGVVGSLLNNTDMSNIDRLMEHERTTQFHSTNPEALPVNIGERWATKIRQKGDLDVLKHSLIFLMQNDAWYYSRVNAIAQNRDKGSTFKEVLFTALMTPLTSKALVDTHGKAKSPALLFRGLNLPTVITQKLINQAQTIIANTRGNLLTDSSAETFMQFKLNDFSQMSGRTNASSSTNIAVPRDVFNFNTIFEIHDPDGILPSKQVGTHGDGTESEYSFYLPDDVALIPIQVIHDGKKSNGEDRYKFTCVAIKSPDFTPTHENGFAVGRLLQMEVPKLTRLQTAMKKSIEGPNLEWIFNLQKRCSNVRGPSPYKTFLNQRVAPSLERCLSALLENDMVALDKALATFPTDREWATFNTGEARTAKREMDGIKLRSEHKCMVENRILPALAQCQYTLQNKNTTEALRALNSLPSEKEMANIPTIRRELRAQVNTVRQEITATINNLERGVNPPLVTDQEQVRSRYQILAANVTKKVTNVVSASLDDISIVKHTISNFHNLQQEVRALRNEKARVLPGSDFADVENLEQQLKDIYPKLYDAFVATLTKNIDNFASSKPLNLLDLKDKIAIFDKYLGDVDKLQQEKVMKHGAASEPLDMADVDGLKTKLQSINQALAKAMVNQVRVLLNQLEVGTFAQQETEALENMRILETLGKTIDDSAEGAKIKASIAKLSEFHLEKQAAYPAMVQLQFKTEALIIQLRQLCDNQHENFVQAQQSHTKSRWTGQWLTDAVGLTKDARIKLAAKAANIQQFQKTLNNENADVNELISALVKKTPSQLEETFGLSQASAAKLHDLLNKLNKPTTFTAKIQAHSALIDEVLSEMVPQKVFNTPVTPLRAVDRPDQTAP
jgi:effector protein SdeA